jgi:hypothetical protein
VTDDQPLSAKLTDVGSFNRPTLAKVLVVVSILPAAAVAAVVAARLGLQYSAQAGVTMLLTGLFMVVAFVVVAVLDERFEG